MSPPMNVLAPLLLCFASLPLAGQDEEGSRPPIKLDVTPAKSPEPKLRYRLLPAVAELESGNAANIYRRAFIEFNSRHFTSEEQVKRIEDWLAKPPGEFRKEGANFTFPLLKLVDRAARMTHADWGVHREIVDTSGILDKGSLQSDSVPAMRACDYLILRSRAALATGRHDEALRSYQTMLATARHLSQQSGHVYQMGAVVYVEKAADELERFIQLPDAPNLYWAMRALPFPLQGVREGIALDLRASVRDFELPERLENEILTETDALKLFENLVTYIEKVASFGLSIDPSEQQKTARKLIPTVALDANEKILRRAGRSDGEIKKMPPAQVYLLAALHHHRRVTNEVEAYLHLPYPEAITRIKRLKEELKEQGLKNPALIFTPVILGPMGNQMLGNLGKAERRLALLCVIEALRLHAAEKGTFPDRLADCVVTVPDDPLTGKPFEYALKNGRATLRSPSTADFLGPKARADRVYEISRRNP